jgi:hypothetical protein
MQVDFGLAVIFLVDEIAIQFSSKFLVMLDEFFSSNIRILNLRIEEGKRELVQSQKE